MPVDRLHDAHTREDHRAIVLRGLGHHAGGGHGFLGRSEHPSVDLAAKLIKHGLYVGQPQLAVDVLTENAELVGSDLIAPEGALLDQEGPHIRGEGFGNFRRQLNGRALDDHGLRS
jgi:hypothetical protein